MQAMRARIAAHLAAGGAMHQVTRHMLGLFHGCPGARGWRRVLSEAGRDGDLATYDRALDLVAGAGGEEGDAEDTFMPKAAAAG